MTAATRPVRRIVKVGVVATGLWVAVAPGTASAASNGPTCSSELGIAVHGQHIVGDYVIGVGRDNLAWPPSGGVVGAAVSAARGAAVPGGPGPGFHEPNGIAPGASFCTGSKSPGVHI